MAGRRLDLADPRELAHIGNLELIARGVVEGFLIGLHRSPFRGFSVEFAENRPYNPGDDPRYIDWKMLARSDRVYVKQYEEETNLRANLLVDVSGSMGWCSDPDRYPTKLAYARMLAATVSLLLLRQGDAAGLLTFDERIRAQVEPRSFRRQWRRILTELAAAESGTTTEAGAAIRDLAGRLRRRGLVILISDLLVDPEGTREALKFLRHSGHEVLVFHILDPGERELPPAGEAIFFDPETGEELGTNSAALRRQYREAVTRAIHDWHRDMLGMGADYTMVTTATPVGMALRQYLTKRVRVG